MNPIEIIGGGIAGLALGIGLRKRGVPVTIYEAGKYPRHRVCGELISGVRAQTLDNLGVLEQITDAETCIDTGWYFRDRVVLERELQTVGFGISRYLLDFRLMRYFRKMGGKLIEETRYLPSKHDEGRVWATGREMSLNRDWAAFKLHAEGLDLSHDVEMHLGKRCYVGLSRIEDDMVNIWGVFSGQSVAMEDANILFKQCMETGGLESLADRISESKVDPSSLLGENIGFERSEKDFTRLELGDASRFVSPLSGNGMAMAFEAAEFALEPLVHYSDGKLEWDSVVASVNIELADAFEKRIKNAERLNCWIAKSWRQTLMAQFGEKGWLSFGGLFDLAR